MSKNYGAHPFPSYSPFREKLMIAALPCLLGILFLILYNEPGSTATKEETAKCGDVCMVLEADLDHVTRDQHNNNFCWCSKNKVVFGVLRQ